MAKAPNQKASVELALSNLTKYLTVKSEQSDERRRSLLPYIWDVLINREDWCLMVKTERDPDFIPVDILWHKPSGEHCDCTTTSSKDALGMVTIKAAWTNHGINIRQRDGRWKPIEVDEAERKGLIKPLPGAEPIPVPNPDPIPIPDPINNSELLNRMGALEANLNNLANRVDQYNVILREIRDKIG